jgi:hypothetical protein
MSTISNYGLLWERKYIFWGWPKMPGHLKGSNGKKKAGRIEVDFREQAGVYILYDSNQIPVYVGQAGKGDKSLYSRLKDHKDDHLWNRWNYFSWFGLYSIDSNNELSIPEKDAELTTTIKDALNDIEAVLIAGVEPKLNKRGANWGEATEWWQVQDDRVKDVTLNDLLDKISTVEESLATIASSSKA